MADSNSNDIESFFENIQQILYDEKQTATNEKEVFDVIANLQQENNIFATNASVAQSALTNLLQTDDAQIITKYLALKEENKSLLESNEQLRKEKESNEEICSKKFLEREESFRETLTKLRNQMQTEEKFYKDKIEKKENELLLHQQNFDALMEIQQEKIVTSFQSKLYDVKCKLRDAEQLNKILDMEIHSLKNKEMQTLEKTTKNAIIFDNHRGRVSVDSCTSSTTTIAWSNTYKPPIKKTVPDINEIQDENSFLSMKEYVTKRTKEKIKAKENDKSQQVVQVKKSVNIVKKRRKLHSNSDDDDLNFQL